MKKSLLVILSAAIVLSSGAQDQKQWQAGMNYSLYKKVNDASRQSYEIAVFIKGDVEKIKSETEKLGGIFKYAAGDIAAVRIPVSSVAELASKTFISRIESNDMKLERLMDTALINNRVLPVHYGFPPLTQGYDGNGVVVGIIDEGVDLTHNDFKDLSGNTRIKFLWDQKINNDPGGITPTPYGYGTEWNSIAINNGSASAHQDGPYGHGTFVTGVAAGNGFAVNNYKGVAPRADIICVSMDLNVSDNNFLSSLADAVRYIFDKADSLGKPCVINISLGTYFGSHDAKDLQALVIDTLITAQPGHSLVCAAGNAGNALIHLAYDVPADTAFTWLRPSGNPAGAYIQIYCDTADMNNIQFALAADDPDYSFRGATPFLTLSSLQGPNVDSVMNGLNRIGIDSSYGNINGNTFSLEVYLLSDSAQYLWRIMTKGSGHIDAWSFNYVFNNLPSPSVMPLITNYEFPDFDQNIVSSFTCSDKVITVGSYTNRSYYIDVNGNPFFYDSIYVFPTTAGPLSAFSSHGPTRDGRIKPDITATGEKVVSCAYLPQIIALLNSQYDYLIASGGQHTVGSGTSFASPAVAGIAALYFQKNPTHTWQQVKDAILDCARRDAFTGNNLPDNLWGYGKADAFAALTGCVVGMSELNSSSHNMNLFPNPASEDVTIYYSFPENESSQPLQLVITDVLGKIISEIPLRELQGTTQISVRNYSSGIYVCMLMSGKKLLDAQKLVVK
ncbi:MAG TPA: S8/S53 family peptidase [Bacteroidia bacterium]|nr:S8/S53 family peptidase [Bacteroidia bacterium]